MYRILFFVLCVLSLSAREPLRVILTGGPGAGKTTILLGMEERGYDIVYEAATDLIKMDLARNVQCPWNQLDFQQRVYNLQQLREMKSLRSTSPIVFFDRSPIDTLTYQNMKWADTSAAVLEQSVEELKSTRFYHWKVFIVENFGECLKNEVRHESNNEALRIQRLVEADYVDHGFTIFHVPPGSPEYRINLILSELAKDLSSDADVSLQ